MPMKMAFVILLVKSDNGSQGADGARAKSGRFRDDQLLLIRIFVALLHRMVLKV